MWSGPRNISTAMMRAFENRPDTVVVDEPLYGAYLARTGIEHPGRAEVLASEPTDLRTAIAASLRRCPPVATSTTPSTWPTTSRAIWAFGWTLEFRTVQLIRDPDEVVASYVRSRAACEPDDIGLLQQGWLQEFWDGHGLEVPILDAGAFLRAPEAHLRWLCGWLGIPFSEHMLAWPPGRRPSDGVWAPYWYAAVWKSTGFAPWRPRDIELSSHDAAVAGTCRPIYEALFERRVRI